MSRILRILVTGLATVAIGGQSVLTAKQASAAPQSGSATVYSTAANGIKIGQPSSNAVVLAASSFIAGALTPGLTATCNGDPIRIGPQGFFAHVVQLKPGANIFHVTDSAGHSQDVTIRRELPPPPVQVDEFKVLPNIQPSEDRGAVAGDLIELSAHATPGAELIASVGSKSIVLRPAAAVARAKQHAKSKGAHVQVKANPDVNSGLDAAYGKVYQRSISTSPDLYVGFYRVTPDDKFADSKVKLTLKKDGKTTSVYAKGKLSVLNQPLLAQTAHEDTIVRLGPGASRTTPQPKAVRFLIDGWQGDQMRCLLTTGHHVWIEKKDLEFETDGTASGPAPVSQARTVNIASDGYGATVTIPLNQRLPYRLEQQLKPNKLVLKVFGVTANTDWISPGEVTESENALVESVNWKQAADGIYELAIDLKPNRQWGFKANYENSNLVVHIRYPPKLGDGPAKYSSCIVCIDPGHGGKESGAIGCSGIKEADINLAIGLRLKEILERQGVKIVMTRISDVDVSLAERVEIAKRAHADLLLSVHNNSLPDGRDPWTEHGSSSYWYHPQSIEFARLVKGDMIKEVGFNDSGTRYQNLFLCRPSDMVAVLSEVGFVINPPEYATLVNAEGQTKAALGLANAVTQYLNLAAGQIRKDD